MNANSPVTRAPLVVSAPRSCCRASPGVEPQVTKITALLPSAPVRATSPPFVTGVGRPAQTGVPSTIWSYAETSIVAGATASALPPRARNVPSV